MAVPTQTEDRDYDELNSVDLRPGPAASLGCSCFYLTLGNHVTVGYEGGNSRAVPVESNVL